MKQHQTSIGKNQEWLTPQNILKSLGEFDLDPCSPINRPWDTAGQHYTVDDDGLKKAWFGRVWLNPPFHRFERPKWMQKMSEHGDGIMLIPAACETSAFKKYVFGSCSGILFLSYRPRFFSVSGVQGKTNCGATICLVAYGTNNLNSLLKSGLGTVLTEVAS